MIKASDEDLAWLSPGSEPADVATRWLDAGASIVAVTRGSAGSVLVSAAGSIAVPAARATVVDTVGAGDSYMAGLLAALDEARLLDTRRSALGGISLADLEAVGRFAANCAGIAVSRAGADPPYRSEVRARPAH